jgi:mannose-6-phosphate isomerase-like protein (cupin superfamily)
MDLAGYSAEPVRYPSFHIFNIASEAADIVADYRNLVLNRVNGACLRLAVMMGDYPWHSHPHSDELFLVVEGRLTIDLADGRSLVLEPWQAVTIPAGTVHRTRAEARTVNLCFEDLGAETVLAEPRPNESEAAPG